VIKGFGSSAAPAKGAAMDTLIGRQTEITGDIAFTGGLHVDGKVKGNVTASADKGASLSVSEGGLVEGHVRVPNVVINGRVVGEVHATERLVLGGKARIVGDVHYRVLQIEAGALVNGQLVHEGPEAKPATEAPGKPAKA